jgi:hypothetical protein
MFVNFLSSGTNPGTIFGLPMAQNLVRRLSNTLFGLPMAQNLVWGCQILFLDYQWPKTLCGIVKHSFWITDGPKPCVRLSNTLFGLPMAQNLVWGLSIALFGLPMAQNLVWGLSNTLFGLSIAQNLVWGCQILLLDYGWPKPSAYSKQDCYGTHSQLDTEQKNSAQPSPQSLSHNPSRIVDEPQPSWEDL